MPVIFKCIWHPPLSKLSNSYNQNICFKHVIFYVYDKDHVFKYFWDSFLKYFRLSFYIEYKVRFLLFVCLNVFVFSFNFEFVVTFIIQIYQEERLPDIDENCMINGLDQLGTSADFSDEHHR